MTRLGRTALALTFLLSIACAGPGTSKGHSAEDMRSLLAGGKWIRHLDEKQFFRDGTYEALDRGRQYPIRGTWRLNGRRLRLTEENETTDHRILTISDTNLEMTFGSAGQRLHYRRKL